MTKILVSKMEEREEGRIDKFEAGKLYISGSARNPRVVLLATSDCSGVVIHAEEGRIHRQPIGHHSGTWDTMAFIPFEGTIKLTQ